MRLEWSFEHVNNVQGRLSFQDFITL